MNFFFCNYLSMVTKSFYLAITGFVKQFMTILLWYINYETLTFFFFYIFWPVSTFYNCWILRLGFDKKILLFHFIFIFKNCSYVLLLVLCNPSKQLLLNLELKMPSDVFFFIVTRSWNMFWNGKIHVSK